LRATFRREKASPFGTTSDLCLPRRVLDFISPLLDSYQCSSATSHLTHITPFSPLHSSIRPIPPLLPSPHPPCLKPPHRLPPPHPPILYPLSIILLILLLLLQFPNPATRTVHPNLVGQIPLVQMGRPHSRRNLVRPAPWRDDRSSGRDPEQANE
jgi:hypothetical protein